MQMKWTFIWLAFALVPVAQAQAQADYEPAPGAVVNTQGGALPWEKNSPQPSAKPMPEPLTPPAAKPADLPWEKQPVADVPVEAGEDRDADDRKLNTIASAYYDVSVKDAQAVKKLDALAKQVKQLMTALKTRSYDADDLLKDAKSLQTRIAVTRKKAAAQQAAQKAVEAVTPDKGVQGKATSK